MFVQPTYKFESLAEDVLSAARTLDEFYASQHIPEPSFAPENAPPDFSSAPDDVLQARQHLRDKTLLLHDLATGPSELLRWSSFRHNDLLALHWISHFKIAENIPLNKPISYASLAATAHVDETYLRRIVRHAMLLRLFHEPSPGHVAHSAGSHLIATNEGIRAWISCMTEEFVAAAMKVVEAHERWGSSTETRHSGWNVQFQADEPLYEWWGKHAPERGERFARTMEECASSEVYHVRHLVNGYDWAGLGVGKVVDVGGSIGHASIAIARAYPHSSFIVQDRPNVVAQGSAALPPDLKERITFQAHDFLSSPQPVTDADVYLLRFILVDYPDDTAVRVLRNLVAAMKKPGARIVVNDTVLPLPGEGGWSRWEEWVVRALDLHAMLMLNAGQRELAGWKTLFAKADPRLRIQGMVREGGSALACLEIVLGD